MCLWPRLCCRCQFLERGIRIEQLEQCLNLQSPHEKCVSCGTGSSRWLELAGMNRLGQRSTRPKSWCGKGKKTLTIFMIKLHWMIHLPQRANKKLLFPFSPFGWFAPFIIELYFTSLSFSTFFCQVLWNWKLQLLDTQIQQQHSLTVHQKPKAYH